MISVTVWSIWFTAMLFYVHSNAMINKYHLDSIIDMKSECHSNATKCYKTVKTNSNCKSPYPSFCSFVQLNHCYCCCITAITDIHWSIWASSVYTDTGLTLPPASAPSSSFNYWKSIVAPTRDRDGGTGGHGTIMQTMTQGELCNCF